MLFDDRIEILCLANQHLALDDGLDSVSGAAFARQDPFAREAQCDNLPAAAGIAFVLGNQSGSDEHDLVAGHSRLAKRPARVQLDTPLRHLAERIRNLRAKPGFDQFVA